MKKIISKTNISLLIITLCAMLFCGLFTIIKLSEKPTTAHAYEAGSSATITGWHSREADGDSYSYHGVSLSTLSIRINDYAIKNITITNDSMPINYVNSPIDVSYNNDNTIHAYMIDNGDETYDCIIYANVETIYAPAICYGMFEEFDKLETINFECFDTSNVVDMGEMFERCPSLKKLDLSRFDTKSVDVMRFMFYNCESLEKIIGLDGFDTSKVKEMEGMFLGCTSLDVLDLSNFNFSAITTDDNVQGMLGYNDTYILALADSFGEDGAALKSSYQQAIDSNSVEARIQVLAYALQSMYGFNEDEALADATSYFNTNIQTIYAPTSLNSRNICLPFNNNAQYVYNNGTSEVETSFLVGRDTAEELAIYVKGETPLAKPEASAPSVTPETGFVDEQLLPALAIGVLSIIAVAIVAKKRKFSI